MEILHRQKLGLAGGEPFPRRGALAFRTMPIAATIISRMRVRAGGVLASSHMAAESRRATGLDGAHRLELAKADVAPVGGTPAGTVPAEDVRKLQCGTGHGGTGLLDRLRLSVGGRYRQREAVGRALDG